MIANGLVPRSSQALKAYRSMENLPFFLDNCDQGNGRLGHVNGQVDDVLEVQSVEAIKAKTGYNRQAPGFLVMARRIRQRFIPQGSCSRR